MGGGLVCQLLIALNICYHMQVQCSFHFLRGPLYPVTLLHVTHAMQHGGSPTQEASQRQSSGKLGQLMLQVSDFFLPASMHAQKTAAQAHSVSVVHSGLLLYPSTLSLWQVPGAAAGADAVM